MKVYQAAMTSSVIDAMLILMRMLEYYQNADDNTPFTSNAIERERLRLLTELLVSDCSVDGAIG